MKRTLQKAVSISLVLFGIALFLYPDIRTWMLDRDTEKYIEQFDNVHGICGSGLTEDGSTKESSRYVSDEVMEEGSQDVPDGQAGKREKESDLLYQEILDYNADIYETEQENFQGTYSYTQNPVDLAGLESEEFGYIEIPAMDVTLPLYIGASDENLAKGAAVLGQTSFPIGGENTNSVIAGHRGWRGGPYFLYIENLAAGDALYITNPWETLTYTVESIDIIDPYDSDAVRIQDGKDMVTLITCHPYLSHGKYRYVVYCVRDNSGADREPNLAYEIEDDSVTGIYGSSQDLINKEKMLRRMAAVMITAITLMTFLYCRRKERKQK